MQRAQALDKGPWLQMHMVPGNCIPLRRQTTEGSPSQIWQAGGGSFLLLPRRHALSSQWLWTFNHNMCENGLEEAQGAAASSLYSPPLFQDTWPCVQLLCADRHAPCQWDLATDKTKPPCLQQNDRAMIRQICKVKPHDIVITRSNELPAQLGTEDLGLILKERKLCWYRHVEYSNGAVKTAFDIQTDGKCGLARAKMTWQQLTKMDCREWTYLEI